MKNLIIIAAGGMGRTFYDIARESIGYGTEFTIKGFIDDNLQALDDFEGYPPILGKISEYQPQEGDVFSCSIGGVSRKKCMEEIEIIPRIQPIRGGTDGARLSYMGLPCPNLCAGGHNFHGRFEYIAALIVGMLVELMGFELIKSFGGIILVKKGIWLNNMVAENK